MFNPPTARDPRLPVCLPQPANAHRRLDVAGGARLRFIVMRLLLPAAVALFLALLAWLLAIATDSVLIGLVGTGLVCLAIVSLWGFLLPARGTAPWN